MPQAAVARPEDWYVTRTFGDGVTLISEHHIDPFYRCNIWHVRGRRHDLLIDSGMGVVSLTGMLPWLAERPIVALASHTHFDHIGSHHEFAERVCHRAEPGILADPEPRATLAERYAVIDMFDALPPGGYVQREYRVRAAPATRLVEHGDVIDLGDRQFQVLHVPGHSPGSIALWEAASATLFSGDAVYDGPLVDDAYHSSTGDYLATMERLRALPVSVVHGGHFPSFGRERYLALIDDYIAGRRAPGCPAK